MAELVFAYQDVHGNLHPNAEQADAVDEAYRRTEAINDWVSSWHFRGMLESEVAETINECLDDLVDTYLKMKLVAQE